MSDCLIVGGGVIGLSLAYELAGHGLRVRLIDAGQPGREASWAAAGMLPPTCRSNNVSFQQLTTLSRRLLPEWAEALRESTRIDPGYRRCGAVYVARDPEEAQGLAEFVAFSQAQDIIAERLSPEALERLEPALRPRGAISAAYLVPDECQIRNPRYLKALLIACAARGVEITPGAAAEDFEIRGDRVRAVHTNLGPLPAESVCVTTGAWTGPLARKLGITSAIRPIRGQIVLLALARQLLSRIVNEGKCYLVPRPDGRLLIGSTEDDVGFDRSTTTGAISGLMQFALSLVPELDQARFERSWGGLRPSSHDGLPYLGRAPGLENAFVASGHFRGGLKLSAGTATVMSQWIRGQQPQIDLTPFRLDRDATTPAATAPAPSTGRETPRPAASASPSKLLPLE